MMATWKGETIVVVLPLVVCLLVSLNGSHKVQAFDPMTIRPFRSVRTATATTALFYAHAKGNGLSSPMAAFLDNHLLQVKPSSYYNDHDPASAHDKDVDTSSSSSSTMAGTEKRTKKKNYTAADDCDVVFDMNRQRLALMTLYLGETSSRLGEEEACSPPAATVTEPLQNERVTTTTTNAAAAAVVVDADEWFNADERQLQTRIRDGPAFQPQHEPEAVEAAAAAAANASVHPTALSSTTSNGSSSPVEKVAAQNAVDRARRAAAKRNHHQQQQQVAAARVQAPSSSNNELSSPNVVVASTDNQDYNNEAVVVVQGGSRVTFRTTLQPQESIPWEQLQARLEDDDLNNNGSDHDAFYNKTMAVDEASLVRDAFGITADEQNGATATAAIVDDEEPSVQLVASSEDSSTPAETKKKKASDDLVVTGVAALALAGLSAVVGVETLVDVTLLGGVALAMVGSGKKRTDNSLVAFDDWNASNGNSTDITARPAGN